MRSRIFLVFTVLIITLASFIGTIGSDHVAANSGLEDKIKSIQEERNENQVGQEQKDKELQELEQKMKLLEDEMRVLDDQTADTNEQIRTKGEEIGDTKKRIDDLKEEIRILEERIAERDLLLKDRVRSMYKNGGSVNYVEVIFGAQSFGDLINRLTALNTITQQDRNILEDHYNDKMMVEEAKASMEQELIGLEEQLNALEVLKATLEKQHKEKDGLMKQFKQEEGELEVQGIVLAEADNILAAQEHAMKAELLAWQERQKQLEQQKKLEAEQQAKLAEEQQKRDREAAAGQTSTQPSAQPSRKSPAPTPTVTQEGNFMRPATGTFTSPYGTRWGSTHHGIDIGKNGRSGDVPIVAAEAGTVITSTYSSSYGNMVMISHNVGGKVITTLYAHMESRLVTSGQRVSKGQKLGYMGNTGQSFGAHLHFEVHEGPWNGAKSNSVDPLRYIPRN